MSSSAANTAGIRTGIGPVGFGPVNFGERSTTNWLILAAVAVFAIWFLSRK